jgi:hypothetical protein
MRLERCVCFLLTLFLLSFLPAAHGADLVPFDYRPDPKAVQRYSPAYRYPQAGWIVLHIEGEPYERGYQHGRLLAPEIAAFLRCAAALRSHQAPADGWRHTRSLVNALFVRRYHPEYLEEMKGIADGASAAGARFDGRPLDLIDVVALNAWPEYDTLDSALDATPTGLEGLRFPHNQPRAMPRPQPMRCSAFAATGPATADGKIVFGHITMFGLYPSLFYNVWLDLKPAKGHRVLMQTYPGGIQSGMDYYLNDAGLLVCETTIRQTQLDIHGLALASRIRQTLQYASSIDEAVAILTKANNGLYTNEWLLGDIKTNEIAMFELGTGKTRLYRSSKNEWFGGTEGFYWGCNNTKDLAVRLETIPGVNAQPANMVWRPSDRDKTWVRLYTQHKGKIDAGFGREAFTTPPVAAYHSLDAKYTTTALARDLKTWALFGPPLGRTWEPTPEEHRNYPEVRPLVSNPWTVLHANPPPKEEKVGPVAGDLSGRFDPPPTETSSRRERRRNLRPVAAWHGTLLPKTDADIWLATAFADYERIVSQELSLRGGDKDGPLTSSDRDRLAVDLFAHRSSYTAGARAGGDVPLAATHPDMTQNDWYRVAAGKGVLALHELRRLLGDDGFRDLMEAFGKEHAGKEVTVAEFQAHAARAAGKPLDSFFAYWTKQPGLPSLRLGPVTVVPHDGEFRVEGELHREGSPPAMKVDVTVETAGGDVTKAMLLEGPDTHFSIKTPKRPRRVVVDKFGWSAKANGAAFSTSSFFAELEQTLIVYGTADEVFTNREAAELLQRELLRAGPNITVPFKSDREVTDADLRSHHLLLIGRPDSNRCVERSRADLPVTFGRRSFTVRNEAYANPGSAVVMAASNPLNRRYSLVVLAGLGAESTRQTASKLLQGGRRAAEVLVLPAGSRPRSLVLPAPDLVKEAGNVQDKKAEAEGR